MFLRNAINDLRNDMEIPEPVRLKLEPLFNQLIALDSSNENAWNAIKKVERDMKEIKLSFEGQAQKE